MKRLLLSMIALASTLCSSAEEVVWTHSATPVGDHRFFYLCKQQQVQQIRFLTIDQRRNRCSVVDYILTRSSITVRRLSGENEAVRNLQIGRDGDLELQDEYTIATDPDIAFALVPPPPHQHLTALHRYDLDGLIFLLAKERHPWGNKAEQAGTGQPATRPESKSEGSDKPQPESEERSR